MASKPRKIRDGVSKFCEICAYETIRPYNFKRHIDTMHTPGEEKFTCTNCRIDYDTQYELITHKSQVHKNGYKCPHCPWNFKKSALLIRHMFVHTGEVLYNCNCGLYGTSHKHNMDRHKKACSKKKKNIAINDVPISNKKSTRVIAKSTKRKRSKSQGATKPSKRVRISTPLVKKESKRKRTRSSTEKITDKNNRFSTQFTFDIDIAIQYKILQRTPQHSKTTPYVQNEDYKLLTYLALKRVTNTK